MEDFLFVDDFHKLTFFCFVTTPSDGQGSSSLMTAISWLFCHFADFPNKYIPSTTL